MSEELPPNERPRSDGMIKDISGTIWFGSAIILIGIFLLLQNMGIIDFMFNWWAIFILIPTVHSFVKAWNHYQITGRFDERVANNLMGGCFLLFIVLIFLFNWDWGKVWPGFLIIFGLRALAYVAATGQAK